MKGQSPSCQSGSASCWFSIGPMNVGIDLNSVRERHNSGRSDRLAQADASFDGCPSAALGPRLNAKEGRDLEGEDLENWTLDQWRPWTTDFSAARVPTRKFQRLTFRDVPSYLEVANCQTIILVVGWAQTQPLPSRGNIRNNCVFVHSLREVSATHVPAALVCFPQAHCR